MAPRGVGHIGGGSGGSEQHPGGIGGGSGQHTGSIGGGSGQHTGGISGGSGQHTGGISGGSGQHTGGSIGGQSTPSSSPGDWSQSFTLAGSHFKDPSTVASIAISCACLLALLGIAIWSRRVKSNGDPVRKIVRGLMFVVALSLTWM